MRRTIQLQTNSKLSSEKTYQTYPVATGCHFNTHWQRFAFQTQINIED
jgi:hypothetical protein